MGEEIMAAAVPAILGSIGVGASTASAIGTGVSILSAASGVAQIIGGMQQAKYEKQARNASIEAEQQANAINMSRADRGRAKLLGSQTAALSAAGVESNTGTSLDLTQDASQQSLLDKAITNFNSQSRQVGIYNDSLSRIQRARAQTFQGTMNLLSAGSNLYDKYGSDLFSSKPYGSFGNLQTGSHGRIIGGI